MTKNDDLKEHLRAMALKCDSQARELRLIARAMDADQLPSAHIDLDWKPTDRQIASACMSYDHGFGLKSEAEKRQMMFQATEWLDAWRKEIHHAQA